LPFPSQARETAWALRLLKRRREAAAGGILLHAPPDADATTDAATAGTRPAAQGLAEMGREMDAEVVEGDEELAAVAAALDGNQRAEARRLARQGLGDRSALSLMTSDSFVYLSFTWSPEVGLCVI